MVPPPRSIILGSTAWVSAYTPVRLTATTASQSSCSTQRTLRRLLEWPALLTRTSTRPYWANVHSASARASAGLATSQARATARPPALAISPATASIGALRRPATTTWAPSAASISAAARPMPVPPPVMIATCPSSTPMACPPARGPGSAPGPDGLFEMVHARRPAVDDHLAHLVEHGRGRRVDQGAEQGKLDHRPVALRDADEARHVRPFQIGEGHVVDLGHLRRVRHELVVGLGPHDHRGDDEARPGAVVVEHAEHGALVERQAHLFLQFAQRRALRGLARVEAAARQRPLTTMFTKRRGPPADEAAGAAVRVRPQHLGHPS